MHLLGTWPFLNHGSNITGRQVSQFFRLHLVKSTTVDTNLLDQMIAGQRLKVSEEDRVKLERFTIGLRTP
jgi:hypothetical protein